MKVNMFSFETFLMTVYSKGIWGAFRAVQTNTRVSCTKWGGWNFKHHSSPQPTRLCPILFCLNIAACWGATAARPVETCGGDRRRRVPGEAKRDKSLWWGGGDSGETLGQRTSKQHCVADGNCGLVGRCRLAEERHFQGSFRNCEKNPTVAVSSSQDLAKPNNALKV